MLEHSSANPKVPVRFRARSHTGVMDDNAAYNIGISGSVPLGREKRELVFTKTGATTIVYGYELYYLRD